MDPLGMLAEQAIKRQRISSGSEAAVLGQNGFGDNGGPNGAGGANPAVAPSLQSIFRLVAWKKTKGGWVARMEVGGVPSPESNPPSPGAPNGGGAGSGSEAGGGSLGGHHLVWRCFDNEEDADRAYEMTIREANGYRAHNPERKIVHPSSDSSVPSSGFRGVSWDKGKRKWRARIVVDGREKIEGRYDSELEAARAYDRAAKRYHADPTLNFPEEASAISGPPPPPPPPRTHAHPRYPVPGSLSPHPINTQPHTQMMQIHPHMQPHPHLLHPSSPPSPVGGHSLALAVNSAAHAHAHSSSYPHTHAHPPPPPLPLPPHIDTSVLPSPNMEMSPVDMSQYLPHLNDDSRLSMTDAHAYAAHG